MQKHIRAGNIILDMAGNIIRGRGGGNNAKSIT